MYTLSGLMATAVVAHYLVKPLQLPSPTPQQVIDVTDTIKEKKMN
jgi:hypothetical protein